MIIKVIENIKEYFQRNNVLSSVILIVLLIIIQITVPIVNIEDIFINYSFIIFSSIAITSFFDLLQNTILKDNNKDYEVFFYKQKSHRTIRKMLEKMNIDTTNIQDENLADFLYKTKRKQINKATFVVLLISTLTSIFIITYNSYQKQNDEFEKTKSIIKEHYKLLDKGLKYKEKGEMDKAYKYFEKVWNLWSDGKKKWTNSRFCNDTSTLDLHADIFSNYLYGNTIRHEITNIIKHPSKNENNKCLVCIKVEEKLFENPFKKEEYNIKDTISNVNEIIKEAKKIFKNIEAVEDSLVLYLKRDIVVDKSKACNIRLFQLIKSKFKLDFKDNIEDLNWNIETTFDVTYIVTKKGRLSFYNFSDYKYSLHYD